MVMLEEVYFSWSSGPEPYGEKQPARRDIFINPKNVILVRPSLVVYDAAGEPLTDITVDKGGSNAVITVVGTPRAINEILNREERILLND